MLATKINDFWMKALVVTFGDQEEKKHLNELPSGDYWAQVFDDLDKEPKDRLNRMSKEELCQYIYNAKKSRTSRCSDQYKVYLINGKSALHENE